VSHDIIFAIGASSGKTVLRLCPNGGCSAPPETGDSVASPARAVSSDNARPYIQIDAVGASATTS